MTLLLPDYRDGPGGPGRLWSLLDMLKFDAGRFFAELDNLSLVEVWLPEDTTDVEYGQRHGEIVRDFDDVAAQCKAIGLLECAEEALRSKTYAEQNKDDPKGIRALSRVLVEGIQTKLEKRVFLWVRPDCTALVDNSQAFGKAIADAFPSAQPDITEAGNCLAASCGTGAVFHLMRAAEVALRVLARDRRITFPKGDLDQKQWGEILNQLNNDIRDLVKHDSTKWPSEDVRQAQIRFYQEANIMFNAFNDVWRKHVSHAHEGAIYEIDRAISAWNHTKRFMERLAGKLSETTLGDEYWKAT